MTTRASTCEGTSGTAVTAGSGAPDAWSSVSLVGTGALLEYSNAQAHRGSTSIHCKLPNGVASTNYAAWTGLPTASASYYCRLYVYLAAAPTVAFQMIRFSAGSTLRSSLRVNTARTISLLNSASTAAATSSGTVPTGGWARVEFELTALSGTTATLTARVYSGANLETATPDFTVSASGVTVGGAPDSLRVGVVAAATMTADLDLYVDDPAYSDVAAIGPGVNTTASGDMTSSASMSADSAYGTSAAMSSTSSVAADVSALDNASAAMTSTSSSGADAPATHPGSGDMLSTSSSGAAVSESVAGFGDMLSTSSVSASATASELVSGGMSSTSSVVADAGAAHSASGDMLSASSVSGDTLAISYPADQLGDQWGHPELQTPTTMRARVDAVLNAGGVFARALTKPHLRVANHAGGSIAAITAFPFEDVQVDTESGWNTGNDHYTIPYDGLWIVAAAVQADGLNSANIQISFGPVDGTLYPDTRLASNITPGGPHDTARIPSVPLRFSAGDVVWLRNVVAFTARTTTPTVVRHYLDLQYVGQ